MTLKSFSFRRQTVKSMPRATRLKGKTEFDTGSNGGFRTPRRALDSVHRNAGCCPLRDLVGGLLAGGVGGKTERRPKLGRASPGLLSPCGAACRATAALQSAMPNGCTWRRHSGDSCRTENLASGMRMRSLGRMSHGVPDDEGWRSSHPDRAS